MTLQKLCLDSFVESIDLYNRAYSVTDNEVLQRGFHILRKAYSYELVSQLFDKHLLEEKYANLVFSKFLKSVDTKWFSKCSWKTITDIFAEIGPSLEKVFFNEYYFHEEPWWEVICHLPNVKNIIYKQHCNDDLLKCMTEYCPRLETLDVTFSYGVSDDGLKHFCQMMGKKRNRKGECLAPEGRVPCPLLREIFVECTHVQNEGVKHLLENVSSLEKIGYNLLPIVLYEKHIDDLGSLHKVQKYNLTHLDLKFIGTGYVHVYDDILKICATLCPNLKSLFCHISRIELLNMYSVLPDVEDLILYSCGDTIVDVTDFLRKKGGKLIHLTLRKCVVSFSVLAERCLRLNHLTVDRVTIQYNEKCSSAVFHNLKALIVEDVDLSKYDNCKGIRHILRLSPVIEKIYFVMCSFFTEEMETEILKCCEQKSLKYIGFGFSSIDAEFLKAILLKCSTLETLNLEECYLPFQFEEYLFWIAKIVPNRPIILR